MRCVVRLPHRAESFESYRVSTDFSCDDMQTPLPQDVFPPVLELTRMISAVIFAQTLIMTVGLCGCASTFTYIRRASRERCLCDRRIAFLLLIFCLNDSLALLHLPIKSVGLAIGYWIFGTTMCRVMLLFENGVCDTFSTFLILFLIFYLRSKDSSRLMSYLHMKTNLSIVALSFLLAIVIHLPMWYTASAREIVVADYYDTNSSIISSRVRYFHCSAHMDHFFLLFFNAYMLLGTYIVPVVIGISLLYRILFHATDQSARRLAACSSVLFAFHLLCLSPQRLILPAYKISGHELQFYLIEHLPSFCAALKWLIYWNLNDCVHQKCELNSSRNSVRLGERRLSELRKRDYLRESAL